MQIVKNRDAWLDMLHAYLTYTALGKTTMMLVNRQFTEYKIIIP